MAIKMLALLPIAALFLGFWALAPGMDGSFLFDDFVNLNALGEFGPIRNLDTLALYVTSTHGDPLGRPLAMLTFLLDAQDWPAAAYPFLHTNVLLHLLNGQLLILVLLRLSQARGSCSPRDQCAAVLGGSIWLLHPMLLSTTLYVVQREAMLAATFVLAGILAWLCGRAKLQAGDTRLGLMLLVMGSLGCTALATLCKANGVLLPALLLVIEATSLPPSNESMRMLAWARRLLLVVPVIAVLVGLMWSIPGAIERAEQLRPWTLGQRLLSEPRVLLDYVRLLLLPRAAGHSLFHDDFTVSTSLFQPATTPLAIAILLALIGGAWRLRQYRPEFSCSILFFFVAHGLEGSVIPLELYFEHRNYLPAMLLFWPLARWLVEAGAMRRLRWTVALLIPAILAWESRAGAMVWAQPKQLALTWAANSPLSARAQAYAAQMEMRDGAFAAAHRRLWIALEHNPNEAQLALNLADAECGLGGLQPSTIRMVEQAIITSKIAAQLNFNWLTNAVARARLGSCDGLDLSTVTLLANAMRMNPNFENAPGRIQDIEHIRGLIFLADEQAEQAYDAFNRALDSLPRSATALQQAALLAANGRPDLARCHIDRLSRHPIPTEHPWPNMQHVHAWLLQRSGYWTRETAHLRAELENDLQHQQQKQKMSAEDCEFRE